MVHVVEEEGDIHPLLEGGVLRERREGGRCVSAWAA